MKKKKKKCGEFRLYYNPILLLVRLSVIKIYEETQIIDYWFSVSLGEMAPL